MASGMRPAFIVVDMQLDFCHEEKGAAPCSGGGMHLVDGISSLLDLGGWTMKVGTVNSIHDDWKLTKGNHPKMKTHVEVLNSKEGKEHETIKHQLWPALCKPGTEGHLVLGLDKEKFDLVVEKNKHPDIVMYSAFGDTRGNKKSDLPANAVSHHLDDELRSKGVTHVFLCGTAGDICVHHTAWDCAEYGFKTYFLEDLVANMYEGREEYEECKRKGVALGVEYVRSDGWQVQMVRNLSEGEGKGKANRGEKKMVMGMGA